jgi:CSLREA domain-containing protein
MANLTRGIRVLIVGFVFGTLSLVGPRASAASTFTVDSALDAVDAAPGDGLCATSSEVCTLRAAVMEANALAGWDTIVLSANTYTIGIPGTGEDASAAGDLDVLDDLTLTGADRDTTIIDGGDIDRILHIPEDSLRDVMFELSGVTIQNGGGLILEGGGILNYETLEVSDAIIQSNDYGGVVNYGEAFLGEMIVFNHRFGLRGMCYQGVCNYGTMNIQDTQFMDNPGGGLTNGGTLNFQHGQLTGSELGLWNFGMADVSQVDFQDAGIFNYCATLNLTDVSITGTDAQLENRGELTFERGAVVSVSGDAVLNPDSEPFGPWGTSCRGDLTLINVTLSGAAGTGLINGGDARLTNVTIADSDGYGLENLSTGILELSNTLVAENTMAACSGSLTSLGHNLDDDGTCGLSAVGDLSAVPPSLGALSARDSRTPTHALLAGSAAIDAGTNSGCPGEDQRGEVRPVDGDQDSQAACDIGAYERNAPLFMDVPWDHWARDYIEGIFHAGVTSGCGGGNYCPEFAVSRAQMAKLLLMAEHDQGYAPPEGTGTVYLDVPVDHLFVNWIEQLADEGLTSGCGGGNYCPEFPVSRAQMAKLLLLGEHGPAYLPPGGTGTLFNDVPLSHTFVDWIEQLASEGVTSGCGGGSYCPEFAVARDQMAVFLVRAFEISIP